LRSSAAASTRSARANRRSAQGQDRILIQVPGIGSAEELKQLIGTTAKLTFNPVVAAPPMPTPVPVPAMCCCRRWTSRASSTSSRKAAVVTGEDLTDARPEL
jgi:preprotein translocase subunit SecD